MNDNLKNALDNVYNEESAQYFIGELVEFSPEFEKNMERMLPPKSEKKPKKVRKPANVIMKCMLAAAAAAAVLGISLTAGAQVTRGFTVKEGFDKFWKKPTISFSAPGANDSPKTLEQLYTPTVFPEGKNYSYTASVDEENTVFGASYLSNREEVFEQPFWFDRDIMLTQYTKKAFEATFETPEYVEISETKVNGCPAYLIAEERYYGYSNTVIWDSGDYIFRLWGNLPASEIIRIAESFEVNENALEEGSTPWAEQ